MTHTLATVQVTHARTRTPTDPHAHHRRAALELHRSRRRARRRARASKLQPAFRAAATLASLSWWRDAEPSAAGSGSRVDL
jgi:hypothetical protein